MSDLEEMEGDFDRRGWPPTGAVAEWTGFGLVIPAGPLELVADPSRSRSALSRSLRCSRPFCRNRSADIPDSKSSSRLEPPNELLAPPRRRAHTATPFCRAASHNSSSPSTFLAWPWPPPSSSSSPKEVRTSSKPLISSSPIRSLPMMDSRTAAGEVKRARGTRTKESWSVVAMSKASEGSGGR